MQSVSTNKPRVINLATSKAKDVEWQGESVSTGIFKESVSSRLKVSRLNIEGDEQADLTVHGGPDKAAYSYACEHYDYWKKALPEHDLPWGKFGENLTTSEVDEETVCIGDTFQIGTAILRVTQPRMPCYKLGIRFGYPGIINHFYKSARWGIYFAVDQEGEIQSGDEIVHLRSDEYHITLPMVSKLFLDPRAEREEYERVLASNLAKQMKGYVQRKMFDRHRG